MNYSVPNTPMNRALASTVTSRLNADARMIAATATFWRLLGIGGLLLMVGMGVGVACYGYSYVTDQRAAMGTLTTAMVDALNKVTLKTEGTVKADGTVKLDATGAVVKLDTGDVNNLLRPTERQLQTTAQTTANVKPVTNYSVFKTVTFQQGAVVTGWSFNGNDDKRPSHQFCYYTKQLDTDNATSMRYDIGEDGVMVDRKDGRQFSGLPFDVASAFANCVWFR
jgi:hypothetical protein